MPPLSAYLGHVSPVSTYWYLHSVPELLALAAQRLENAEAAPRRSSPRPEAFFTQHLACHPQASPRTIGSYRDTWRLFLGYALDTTGTAPRP